MKRSDIMNKKIDALLALRTFEPADDAFVERIIAAARHIAQRRQISALLWWRLLCAEFHIASPRYVLASLLALGFLTGFYVHLTSASSENEPLYVQEFLYDGGNVL